MWDLANYALVESSSLNVVVCIPTGGSPTHSQDDDIFVGDLHPCILFYFSKVIDLVFLIL